ncbi:MAG: dihydropteroate synthase [Myxococcales bacterium]|nr:MAG: dihydropteroate synthase [Myxococcales bacterium]
MIVIAENINVMSKSLGPAMKERNPEPIVKMAKVCHQNGADYLDINIGPARKNGPELLQWIVKTVQSEVPLPLSLDTTNIEAMVAGLEVHNGKWGKPIINSISAMTERMDQMLPLVGKYNASMVALLYGKDGIPRDANERGALAADLLYRATEAGIPFEEMYFDPIVVPVSSQQNQVVSCTEFMGMIAEMAPGAKSTCGLSNVSNGSPEHLRAIINQIYLIMLGQQGLASAIMDGLDKEIIAIAKGKRPELAELVRRASNGEPIDTSKLDQRGRDVVKTVKILRSETLYSDSWLEV